MSEFFELELAACLFAESVLSGTEAGGVQSSHMSDATSFVILSLQLSKFFR